MSAHHDTAGPVLRESRRIIQTLGPWPSATVILAGFAVVAFMWYTREDAIKARALDAYQQELAGVHRQYQDELADSQKQLSQTIAVYSEQLSQLGEQHATAVSEIVADSLRQQAERDDRHSREIRELVTEQKLQMATLLRREKAVSQMQFASMLRTQKKLFERQFEEAQQGLSAANAELALVKAALDTRNAESEKTGRGSFDSGSSILARPTGASGFTAVARSWGVWKSPRSVYRVQESGGKLLFHLIDTTSPGIRNATGTLFKSSSGYKGSISLQYYNGRTLRSEMSVTMIGEETMSVTADQVYWNAYGRETSRRPTTFVMRRQSD